MGAPGLLQFWREGLLPDGKYLQGHSAGNAPINGRQVTCISCHRRNDLGSSEGKNQAPPVIVEILFHERTQTYRELGSKRLSGEGARTAYTEESLLTAINEGRDVTGRIMSPLMPRYIFSKTDLILLIQYVNSISLAGVPGITDSTIHFATIFTPDTPLAQRATAEKNNSGSFS